MLPSGHFAAGYLTTRLTVQALFFKYPQVNEPQFWIVGLLASILVDLDELYAFAKIGRPIGHIREVNHRRFITHAPLLHLGIGIVMAFIGLAVGVTDISLLAIFYVVGTWTHFFFDSFGYGIMWLWPFSSRIYAFYHREVEFELPAKSILGYWKEFLIRYSTDFVLYLEAVIIALAFLIKFKFLNF